MSGEREQSAPQHSVPSDFCRTCRGTGRLADREYRQGVGAVTVWMTCWACNGSGVGK